MMSQLIGPIPGPLDRRNDSLAIPALSRDLGQGGGTLGMEDDSDGKKWLMTVPSRVS